MKGRPTVMLLSPVSHTVDLREVLTLTVSDTLGQMLSQFKLDYSEAKVRNARRGAKLAFHLCQCAKQN